jgi:hypothetical protein
MTRQQLKLTGMIALALTGLIHLIETPECLDEQRYIGILFALSAVGAAIALFGIAKDRAWGWLLGLAVAAGCFAGYVLSRTVGLPSFREASWSSFLEPPGLLSLLAEAVFIVVALRTLTAGRNLAPGRVTALEG